MVRKKRGRAAGARARSLPFRLTCPTRSSSYATASTRAPKTVSADPGGLAVTHREEEEDASAASTRTAQGLVECDRLFTPHPCPPATAAATSAGLATQVRGRTAAKMGRSGGGGISVVERERETETGMEKNSAVTALSPPVRLSTAIISSLLLYSSTSASLAAASSLNLTCARPTGGTRAAARSAARRARAGRPQRRIGV